MDPHRPVIGAEVAAGADAGLTAGARVIVPALYGMCRQGALQVPVIGVAAFALVVPVTVALLVVLAFLILSYRQTIKAYPTAGGAYIVTLDNFGIIPAQVAGVALLTDYILTVAVSVAAGTAALSSAASGVAPCRVEVSVAFIAIIALAKAAGHMSPSSSNASGWNPRVA